MRDQSRNAESPSCGGNGGHRISVVRCPIGFLRPAAHRSAAADSHMCFSLFQMFPPALSSDLTSAPTKSPKRGDETENSFVFVAYCTLIYRQL